MKAKSKANNQTHVLKLFSAVRRKKAAKSDTVIGRHRGERNRLKLKTFMCKPYTGTYAAVIHSSISNETTTRANRFLIFTESIDEIW